MIHEHIRGLIAPPFTPMTADGRVDLDRIEAYADFLHRNGIAGAFVCGTTGESMSLSTEERLQIAGRWMEVAPKDFRVIIHVGHTSLAECKAMAGHAQRIGAFGIAAMAPFFFRPQSIEILVEFCREVASGAASTPFYYYHIPGMTGVDFSMPEFLHLAGKRIPSLKGMKFTHTNLMDYLACLQMDDGRYDMLFGEEGMLLSALALGTTGAVGTDYNHLAPVFLQMIDAYQKGEVETAKQRQIKANLIIDILSNAKCGFLAAAKAMMKMIGFDCGLVRPPLLNIGHEEFDQLEESMNRAGLFAICSK